MLRTIPGKSILRRSMLAAAALTAILPASSQPAHSERIRTITIASLGDHANDAVLREKLIERLNKSGQFKVVDNPATSDAVLRGTSNIWATGTVVMEARSGASRQINYQGYLSIELVDKNNQPLWSYLVTPSRFRTDSIAHDLANRAADRLIDAVRSGTLQASPTGSGYAATPRHAALHAAGSTLAQPLYLKWFESSGIPVAYEANGSEAGIAELAAGKVDFAASDMPLTPETSSASIAVTHFPTVAGGVVPIYNLPGTSDTLRFTPQILAGIYSGTIHRWNDPHIRAANGSARLPEAEISVVHRSDGSGTTFVWTSYLSLISPEWKSRIGSGTHVTWPVGTAAEGNNGVANLVQKTPNSIGYVELIYAIQHELNYGAVENLSGQFIKADLNSITAAAQPANQGSDKYSHFSILNAPGKAAYPISTFTWLLIPTQRLDAQKKESITALLRWMLTTGQKDCSSLGYAPLPREVAARALREVDALK